MAAIRGYGRRIVWSVAALAALLAIGLAAVERSEPLKRGLKDWTRPGSGGLSGAKAAYERENWQEAADLSRQLLKPKPDNPELLRVYARASARLGRDETAGAVYDRLGDGRLEPEDSFLMGLVRARTGNLERAFDIWYKAAQSGPDHPEMLEHVARLSARLQRLDEAAWAAQKLASQPGWEARGLLLVGEIQGRLANPKGAVDAVRKGLELDPTAKGAPFPPDYFRKLLARSSLEIGQPNLAIEALKALSGSGGTAVTDPEANWLWSRAYLQTGNTADALAALGRSGSYRDDNPLKPEPSPYIGEARCASCHAKEARAYERSRHSRTLHRGRALLDLPLPNHPLADPDDPKVTHTFTREQDHIRVETRAGDHVFLSVVAYAFGVPDRYVTMIGRDAKKEYRALRLSSYHTPEGVQWGRTSGDVPDSDMLANVRGQPIPERDGVVRCVYCHVTNFRDFRDPPPEGGVGPAAADAGIGCERCHGPGSNHVAAIKANFPDRAIVNAGTASSSAIGTQCAECHVVGVAGEVKRFADNPRYARSPGATLTVSRCYTESGGGMSCLTCHDPHRDDDKPATFYEAKCLTCHSPQTAGQTPCRVNPSKDCLNCHMPKVPMAVLHTSLTDHYIRVHRQE